MTTPAASGYFSAPSDTLDPNLFNGDELKPEVRSYINGHLHNWLSFHNLADVVSAVYITGSGISYQWAADRGNGDLDVMVKLNVPAFDKTGFAGFGENELAHGLNGMLKEELWPDTAEAHFGGHVYEVTYYVLPASEQISNAYAAYDVTSNTCVTRPPELPSDPKSLYPADWFSRADSDNSVSAALSARYRAISEHLARAVPGSAEWHNLNSQMTLTVRQASSLYDDIHTGRTLAFGDQGRGYGDWHNFRWQRAKQSGTVAALRTIRSAGRSAREAQETALYGRPLEGAQELLWRAVQQHSSGSYST